jgi:outer membrane immunogenic protein
MKKRMITGTMLGLALVGSTALSAGDWDKGYWGFTVGYGTGKGKVQMDPLPTAAQFVNFMPTTLNTDPKGALAGFQVGQSWQSGGQVFGWEADLLWSGQKGDKTQTPIVQNNGTPFPGVGFTQARTEVNVLGSFRGRYGFLATPQTYCYGTAGLAFGHLKDSATVDFRPVGTTQYPASVSKTKAGWTAGLGVEWIVAKGMTTHLEALYADLGKETSTVDAVPALPPYQMKYTFETKETQLRFGINFNF